LVDALRKYLTNLGDKIWSMPKKAANPFPGDYEPELDTTLTLNPELLSWYASLIGMLRWMVEIGRVNIVTEVSKMASQMGLSPATCQNRVERMLIYDHAKVVSDLSTHLIALMS